MSLVVRFEAEIRLLDDECPETLNFAAIRQAVQDEIGHVGVIVLEVIECEEEVA